MLEAVDNNSYAPITLPACNAKMPQLFISMAFRLLIATLKTRFVELKIELAAFETLWRVSPAEEETIDRDESTGWSTWCGGGGGDEPIALLWNRSLFVVVELLFDSAGVCAPSSDGKNREILSFSVALWYCSYRDRS
jgi:hypothetical protein